MAPPVRPAELCHLSLDGWSCVLDPATLEITATAPCLTQAVAEALPQPLRVTDLVRSDTGASFTYPDLKAAVRVEALGRRLRVRVSSQQEWEIRWPVTGRTSPASRLIVTSGEGLALPARDAFWPRMIGDRFCGPAASGRWSMPFWGIGRESSTFTYIVGADAVTEICLQGEAGVLSAGAAHRFRAREGFPDLDVTIVPSEGSVLGPAKEYRQWLVEQGGFVSFRAKRAKLPEAARLVGASHAYLWGDGRTDALLERLKSAGIERMWLGYAQEPRGSGLLVGPAFIAKARAQGYLVGPYDTYDNIQDPKTSDSISSVWDADLFRPCVSVPSPAASLTCSSVTTARSGRSPFLLTAGGSRQAGTTAPSTYGPCQTCRRLPAQVGPRAIPDHASGANEPSRDRRPAVGHRLEHRAWPFPGVGNGTGMMRVSSPRRLFVVRPESENLDDALLLQDLIHQTMLDVDAARMGAGQVAHELLEWGRHLERVSREQGEEFLGTGSQAGARQFSGVSLGLGGVDDLPDPPYHPGSVEHLWVGVPSPRRMDARMPGIESR